MITEGRRPPRELFGVHRSRRVPQWVPWSAAALAAIGLVLFVVLPTGEGLLRELVWRAPLQLGFVGLIVAVAGRRTTTLDETGVRCSGGVRTDAVSWEELVDVRVTVAGAVLRAADGRVVRVSPLPHEVAEALRVAVRSGGTA